MGQDWLGQVLELVMATSALRGVTVGVPSGRIPKYFEHIGVNADQHLLTSGPGDFEI